MRNKSGFSMIEIVIVIGIAVMLSSVLIAYNRSGERKIILATEQAKLTSFLNRAKSLALQKKDLDSTAVVCAYGAHFDKTDGTVQIFNDLDASLTKCDDPARVFEYNTGEEIEKINIDEKIELAADYPDVMFVPPYLTVKLSSATDFPLIIKLQIIGDSETIPAEVEVGAGGGISSN